MRLLQLAAAALLSATVLAAKKSPEERFRQAHAQAQPIKLDDKAYEDLTSSPRNYSIAVLLTAMDARFACGLCKDFQPEWELLGRTWSRGDKEGASRLLFGTLDFLDGKSVFQKMQLTVAPVLLLFHPTTGPHAKLSTPMERLDFNMGINKAEPVHAWLSRLLPDRPHPPVVRPFDYVRIAVTLTAVLGVITFLSVAAPYILPVLQNRNLWAAVSLIAVLLFTSGHMFNHIRKVPYVQMQQNGAVSYFAGGFQNQFGLETQIVAAMYGVLSFATISLALKVPRIANQRSQQVAVFVWGGVVLVMYSFLLSVFRVKNGGYPFWLPPF